VVLQALRLDRFFQPDVYTWSDFTGLYMTPRLLLLLFVPGAFRSRSRLPSVRRPEGRAGLNRCQVLKERVLLNHTTIVRPNNTRRQQMRADVLASVELRLRGCNHILTLFLFCYSERKKSASTI